MKKRQNMLNFTVIIASVFLILTSSCDKEDENNNEQGIAPILSTSEITNVTENTATSGGIITDEGSASVTSRGVCWSTHENPTIEDNKTEDGSGSGNFTSDITNLEPNTTYYVKAYAINSEGTGYGNSISFTTNELISESSFIDSRDGKTYKTVIIGNQEWMAENLAYAPSSGNFWAYDNNEANAEIYGYLYDWETAKEVCPNGWHLPSSQEWTELLDYLGGEEVSGGKLKSTGTIEAGTGKWRDPNTGATNQTGFSALPGGNRDENGNFDNLGYDGYWWSSTEHSTADRALYRYIYHNSIDIDNFPDYKEVGFSVRCVKD